ncbi:MAG: DegT/DnrJ/EryC1/StrS family aminotransferase [Minwuia sp.]|uniref:DegT/DnrJ/EryC1/StrS family aminotransferase n=1 Tax=Minwuia sp. TaxID=2493630 RepID=UPI003A87167B
MSERPARRDVPISLPSTGEAELEAVRGPIESGWLTQGPKVAEFEKRFAERHDVPHALAVTSCTTGLHLILAAMEIGPGDEVIVPAFTWVATANVVLYCGATPVLADVDRDTFNLDIDDVLRRVTSRTKAVIAVHLFGRCMDMDALSAALPSGIEIIEDAACAAGAAWQGRPAGSLGRAASFSFHPRKSVTTGEGGMVTTDDPALAERMNMMRNHGASISEEQRHHGPRPYLLPDFNLLGFNYRMTDLQGAVGLVQFGKLDRFIDERAAMAKRFTEAFADINWLRTPTEPQGGRHGWQAYVLYVDPDGAPMLRNDMMEALQEMGVSTRPGTHAVHMLGLYRDRYGLAPHDFPGARDCAEHSMAIPLHNRMTEEDFDHVVRAVRSLAHG